MCGLGAILQSSAQRGGRAFAVYYGTGARRLRFSLRRFTDQYPHRDWRRTDLAVLLYRVADFPPLPAIIFPLYHRHHVANGVD